MPRARCFPQPGLLAPLALLALATLPVHAQAPAATVPPTAEPTLDQVRAATSRYRDVKVALADGYIADPSGMCVSAAMEGRPAEEGAMVEGNG